MLKYIFQNAFIEFCKKNKFEINNQQIKIINSFESFINPKKKIFNFLPTSDQKLCFYLSGNVGVGKTMLLNFIYNVSNILGPHDILRIIDFKSLDIFSAISKP